MHMHMYNYDWQFSAIVYSNTFLSDACAIELGDTVVVTGGQWSASRVQVYSVSGPQEELPNMLAPRYGHACGLFVNSDQQTVSSNKYAFKLNDCDLFRFTWSQADLP